MTDDAAFDLSNLTADIVAAYVSNNKISPDDLAKLIGDTYSALGAAGTLAPAEPQAAKPDKGAVRKSVHPDFLTSFIDGKPYKSLKRHLATAGMTPDDYRAAYGLPKDYPMVSASYSAQRSALAKSLGLGRKAAAPAPTPTPEAAPAKAVRGRKPKVIKSEEETFS